MPANKIYKIQQSHPYNNNMFLLMLRPVHYLSGILFFHFMINIAMVIGLAPVIGIPLPFFSKGGSAILSFGLMVFILLRLDSERKVVLR